jgi:hypothetical protein
LETQTAATLNGFLTSLSTAGLVIVSITVIIFALSKFGVFNKLLDKEMSKRSISTGFDEEKAKSIFNKIDTLLENDKQTVEMLEKLDGRLTVLETSFCDYRQEAYKRMVFNEHDLLIDRMAVGLKYLIDGGNGETRKYLLEKLAYEDLVIWNGLCKALNANQFWAYERRGEVKEPNGHRRKTDLGGELYEPTVGTGHFGIQL